MLLMLVLPLQAFASAGMLGCVLVHPVALEHVATTDAAMTGCHEQKQQDAPATQHNCTHCAVCALASVLLAPASQAPALIPDTDRFVSQSAAPFSGFIPDGPERPPRLFLA